MLSPDRNLYRRARLLVGRLERLSADSSYAHQASGIRGAIIRSLGEYNETGMFRDPDWILLLIEQGDKILVAAAQQIPDSDK